MNIVSKVINRLEFEKCKIEQYKVGKKFDATLEEAYKRLELFSHNPKTSCYQRNKTIIPQGGYDVSVIVPVYNTASYLKRCIDVLDLTHGSNLKLYIRDANYYIIGHHRNIEEKGDDSWIVLTEFIKHSKDDNRVIETHDGKEKDMIAIRLSDVEYAEIFN